MKRKFSKVILLSVAILGLVGCSRPQNQHNQIQVLKRILVVRLSLRKK